MHFWIVLGHFATLPPRPDHESVHWSLNVVVAVVMASSIRIRVAGWGIMVGVAMVVRVLVHFGCHRSGGRWRNGEVSWRHRWWGGVSRSRAYSHTHTHAQATDHAQTQIDAGQLR